MIVALLIALFLLGYAFIGYPILLALLAGPRSGRLVPAGGDGEKTPLPSVTMLLSVYNEEAVIGRKLENFLALRYPCDRLSLIIVSDSSTDATETIIAERIALEYSGEAEHERPPRITLLRQEGRLGKTAALNLAARHAQGDILLFTDADAMLRPDCVTHLAEPFSDPATGLSGGRSLYTELPFHERRKKNSSPGETPRRRRRDWAPEDCLPAEGPPELWKRASPGSLYRCYEEWIKEREGRLFGIVGADGAAYAMRRELYTPLPPEYINDLLHPVQVVLAGKKAVAVWDAVALEQRPNGEDTAEFARQTRIMAQSWLICLSFCLPLLRAGRYGFLWQFLSHKLLRWLALPLLVLAAGAAAGTGGGPLTVLTLAGLGLLALAAGLGAKGKGGKAGRIAWLFVLQSTAALAGLARLVRGERFITWSPRGR